MLDATGLGHHYGHGDWLFRSLGLRVDPGDIVAVLGPNARGKTTLLTCLAGVRAPREGTVVHEGVIGYVPQNHNVDHPFSAHEMVVMGRARHLRPWRSPTRDDLDAAWRALERVGIADIGGRSFGTLSGGQRQLTLMARALVSSPSVMILDEPTSALDLRNQRRVLTTIQNLADEGVGIVFTTHDPTHALHVSQRTVLMDDRVSVGPTAKLLTAETLSRLYGTPVHTTEFAFSETSTRTVVIPDLLVRKP